MTVSIKIQEQDLHTTAVIHETAEFLKSKGMMNPTVGIVLGTGLGSLVKQIQKPITVPFSECPHFPQVSVQSHAGNVVFGDLEGKKVVAMEGRFHHYEGYSLKQVTYPVRVMKALGIQTLVLSNAAGGLNPQHKKGDLMLITDHINLIGDSPLAGPNDDALGLRFPDMIEPYNQKLINLAKTCAKALRMGLREGVYVGVKGPQLETKAEYKWLRGMGADAVGMSTVPEAIAAVHAGLQTLAVSCITDLCIPETLKPVNIEEIIATANKAEPLITKLIAEVIKRI
jgi:purine-nucleoside phosphorylase